MNLLQRSDIRLRNRAGQSLVEFALVALVLYMLLAAILTFGHMLYVAQGLQGAADLAAREISRTPLAADLTLDDPITSTTPGALFSDDVRRRIFDEAFLVIDLQRFYNSVQPTLGREPNIFEDAVPQMPVLNQQLVALMIVDRPDFNGDGNPDAWLLRYPGALLRRKAGEPIRPPSSSTYPDWVSTDFVIGIPIEESSIVIGGTSIRWLNVVEEIDTEVNNDDRGNNPDPFAIRASIPGVQPIQGIVALRINYPFQSASMSSFPPNYVRPSAPTIGRPKLANEDDLGTGSEMPGNLTGAPLVIPGNDPTYAGTYGGQYGMGAQGVFGQTVRPYRRVISSQAIYRREVFE